MAVDTQTDAAAGPQLSTFVGLGKCTPIRLAKLETVLDPVLGEVMNYWIDVGPEEIG